MDVNFIKKVEKYCNTILSLDTQTKVLSSMTNVNTHIHTPYSFSSFDSINQAVLMAKQQKISALGINDFNTTEGYAEFAAACEENGIYPLFNIEFISLNHEDKEKGLRWNDPINPGIIYLCGKGLNYPFMLSNDSKNMISSMWKGTQDRIWKMLGLLNDLMKSRNIDITLNYNQIRNLYAKNSVRERHVAKGLHLSILQKWPNPDDSITIFRHLFDDPSFTADPTDMVFMQNEIRNRLLKAGKKAYVDENYTAFLNPSQTRNIILEAGGIPCYPMLADDQSSNSDYEKDISSLAIKLHEMEIFAVEFLPYRTSFDLLKKCALFLYNQGFCVTFGTEHNTPELLSLVPTARNNVPFDSELSQIAYEGACIIAAHQAKHRLNRPGFVDNQGKRIYYGNQLKEFIRIGEETIRKTNSNSL